MEGLLAGSRDAHQQVMPSGRDMHQIPVDNCLHGAVLSTGGCTANSLDRTAEVLRCFGASGLWDFRVCVPGYVSEPRTGPLRVRLPLRLCARLGN